jgi:hypothetical protein
MVCPGSAETKGAVEPGSAGGGGGVAVAAGGGVAVAGGGGAVAGGGGESFMWSVSSLLLMSQKGRILAERPNNQLYQGVNVFYISQPEVLSSSIHCYC